MKRVFVIRATAVNGREFRAGETAEVTERELSLLRAAGAAAEPNSPEARAYLDGARYVERRAPKATDGAFRSGTWEQLDRDGHPR